MLELIEKNREWENTIREFLRYGVVGGVSFCADFVILFLFCEYVFIDNAFGLYLATACGFLGGLIVNTLLSIYFVFLSDNVVQKQRGKNIRDILFITLIGLVGLLLTEVGMYIGTKFFLWHYLWVKIFVSGMVLVWNYSGRKVFVFN